MTESEGSTHVDVTLSLIDKIGLLAVCKEGIEETSAGHQGVLLISQFCQAVLVCHRKQKLANYTTCLLCLRIDVRPIFLT